jgi:hypothetical protein
VIHTTDSLFTQEQQQQQLLLMLPLELKQLNGYTAFKATGAEGGRRRG